MNAVELIKAITDAHLTDISELNENLAGHNGPYYHSQTLVRNLSHWLVTCAALAEWTKQEKYRDAARICADYLKSDEARPGNAAFFHRDHESRDRCNGLIGPAWTFEGLIAAARLFEDNSFLELGRNVYELYPFDEKEGRWKTVEVDGSVRGFDDTFNHQLWFAVTAYLLGEALNDDEIMRRTRVFFDRIAQHLTVLDDGLILHLSHRKFEESYRRMKSIPGRLGLLKQGLRQGKLFLRTPNWDEYRTKKESEFKEKSVGYHSFNTYAFSLIRKPLEHDFWQTHVFLRLRDYFQSNAYKEAIRRENTYGFPYNAPGFEVPVSLLHLCDMDETQLIAEAQTWLQEQIDRTFDSATVSFSRNTEDPDTLTARIYELTRLPKNILEKIHVNAL